MQNPQFYDPEIQSNDPNQALHQIVPASYGPVQAGLAAYAYQNGQQTMVAAPHQPGIPHSQSHQAIHTIQSPDRTPDRALAHANGYFSPDFDMSTTGGLSEPRNYAPRTAGLPIRMNPLMMEPPPKFELPIPPAPPAKPGRESRIVREIVNPVNNQMIHPSTMVADFASESSSPVVTALVELPRSETLTRLTSTATGMPTLADAMDPANFPFIEGARQAKPMNYGVIKLKNIPFSTSRSEVVAFLGRNSKILNDSDEGVHIIMEKVTSKTMDAYVEFVTLEDAMKAVERHRANLVNGRLSRLGDRPVEVEVASQASLMKDLFPIARGVFWNGATPEIMPHNANEPWENFKGFISEEEMVMLVKHVEVPHRSPFSRECPQRPYECLISTIKKFPWYLTDYVTIKERQAIFKATCELIRQLIRSMLNQDDSVNLTPFLLRRVVQAAMLCPGFTPLMKDGIAWITNMQPMDLSYYRLPRSAEHWRHQYALAPKPNIPLDVVEWYVAIIREQTSKDILALPLRERTELQEKGKETDMHWGYFWAEVGYQMGPYFDNMTLAQAAQAEFSAVERILTRAFAGN